MHLSVYLLLCANEVLFTVCVCLNICIVCGVVQWAVYMMLIGYNIYMKVDILVNIIW